jgi:16S rRNA processing protein RimM
LSVVEDESDRFLGILVEVLETGANDVYIVRDPQGADLLLPDIESVIVEIDLSSRQMRVHLLNGLVGP